jgi:hypothetical protein
VSRWIGGLAEWEEGETTYLSVAFTWLLDEAYTRAELLAEQLGCGVLCAENWPADSVGLQAIPGLSEEDARVVVGRLLPGWQVRHL